VNAQTAVLEMATIRQQCKVLHLPTIAAQCVHLNLPPGWTAGRRIPSPRARGAGLGRRSCSSSVAIVQPWGLGLRAIPATRVPRHLIVARRHAYFALSDQDIAKCLAIPLGTLKTRICAAMRQFRHKLTTLRR
jgi:hypothetical protein